MKSNLTKLAMVIKLSNALKMLHPEKLTEFEQLLTSHPVKDKFNALCQIAMNRCKRGLFCPHQMANIMTVHTATDPVMREAAYHKWVDRVLYGHIKNPGGE